MAQAPTQDFIVNSGLNVVGTNTVTSSTGNTGTLQVDGGAAIAKNLIVGTDVEIYGDLTVYGSIPYITITTGTFTDLTVTSLSTLNALTAGVTTVTQLTVNSRLAVGGLSELNNVTVANQTNSTSSTTGALQVSGGVGIQKDLWVGGKIWASGYEVLTTGTIIASTLQEITEKGSSTTIAISVLSTVSSTSTDTGALTIVGGVGIGGDLYVNNIHSVNDIYANALYISTASYINNSLIITTATVDLYATKTSILAGTDTAVNTSTGIVTIWNTSTLQSVTDRGATTTNVIVITNTQSNTSTVAGNALQVSGGVGIDGSLYVNGAAYFQNNVIFAGTSTYIYSTNTVYTDNLINLHVPAGSTGSMHSWLLDDGKDIGFVYHYYKGADYDAFLGLSNETGYLEWYNDGEEVGGLFTGTSYGTFKTGAIILTSTTASVSTTTGALIVAGGVGIGGALNVANTSYIHGSRILVAGDLETVTTTATYITNDPTSQVGLVAIAGTSTTYGTYNFGTVADIQTINDFNTGTNTGFYSINDASGAPAYIVYIGFSNVTQFTRIVLNVNYTQGSGHTVQIDLYNYVTAGWDTYTTYSGSTNWFQFILATTNSVAYISGGKVVARLYHVSNGNTAHRTWIDYVALEDSIQGGQGPRGATGATGAQGAQGLTTSTTSTFIFFNTTSASSTSSAAVVAYGGVGIGKDLYVGGTIYGTVLGSITTATNLALGTAGQVPYQTAPGATSFYGPGALGQLLVSGGPSAPVYTNTSSIYVGRAVLADTATTANASTTATNLALGTAGQVPYQTAPGVTNFYGPGTAGNVLVSNGTSAPTYNNTLTLVGTLTSISTTTGVLQVRGGVGVGGSVYVGNRVGFVNASNVSRVYQVYNSVTDSLDTVFE